MVRMTIEASYRNDCSLVVVVVSARKPGPGFQALPKVRKITKGSDRSASMWNESFDRHSKVVPFVNRGILVRGKISERLDKRFPVNPKQSWNGREIRKCGFL